MNTQNEATIVQDQDQTGGVFTKLLQQSMLIQRMVASMGNSFPGSAQIAAGIVGEDGAAPRFSTVILRTKTEIEGGGTAAIAGGAQRYSRHNFARACARNILKRWSSM